MDSKITIYVEGHLDSYFIKSLCAKLNLSNYSIIITGGYSSIENYTRDIAKSNTSLVIFDADSKKQDADTGGVTNRKEHLKKLVPTLKEKEEQIFLFPNNIDDGYLDLLLETILKKQCYIETFKEYAKEIKDTCNGVAPDKHSMIYAYLESCGLKSSSGKREENSIKILSENINFNSSKLKPLKEFLEKFLKKNIK